MIVLKSMDAQPQFDDVDGFAHVFDSSELEDEWKGTWRSGQGAGEA